MYDDLNTTVLRFVNTTKFSTTGFCLKKCYHVILFSK